MASHKSAKKRIRQTLKIAERNRAIRSRMRNTVRRARAALEANAENKLDLVQAAIKDVQRAGSKNVLKRQTAQRYVSRLMRAAGRAQA